MSSKDQKDQSNEGKHAGRKPGAPNYTEQDKLLLLELIEKYMPHNSKVWKRLEDEYNERNQSKTKRHMKQLKKKFADMYGAKPVTGTAGPPYEISEAIRLKRLLDDQQYTGEFGGVIDDDDMDSSNSSSFLPPINLTGSSASACGSSPAEVAATVADAAAVVSEQPPQPPQPPQPQHKFPTPSPPSSARSSRTSTPSPRLKHHIVGAGRGRSGSIDSIESASGKRQNALSSIREISTSLGEQNRDTLAIILQQQMLRDEQSLKQQILRDEQILKRDEQREERLREEKKGREIEGRKKRREATTNVFTVTVANATTATAKSRNDSSYVCIK